MESRNRFEEYLNKGYRVGSIVRVGMRNFLTYDDAVAYPGPQLNIVLGPNGTGKSALTHAICLACGGAPKSIGRSDDITQFVKRDKIHEGISFCEVDILSDDGIKVVRRTINSENKTSKWAIGGRSTTFKEVKDLMAQLNIDVDNICSFMPQDKVGSFTQQTPQGLLQKTLQSIKITGTEKTLYDEQKELAEHQQNNRTKENEVKAKRRNVEQLYLDIAGMDGEVKRMRQRSQNKDKLELYTIKAIVVEAEECEALVQEKQRDVDTAVKALNDAQSECEPLELQERELKKSMALKDRHVQAAVAEAGKIEAKIADYQSEIDSISGRIENTVKSIDSLDESRRALEDRKRSIAADIDRIDGLREEAAKHRPIHQANLEKLTSDLRVTEDELMQINSDLNATNALCNEKADAIRSIQSRLSSITDSKQLFLRKLGHRRDVQTAYDWVNRHAARFRGEVLGPVGMYIQVDDLNVARMVETFIPYSRLLAFIADNREDYEYVNRELRNNMGLKIDLYLIEHVGNLTGSYSPALLREVGEACGGQVKYLCDRVPAPSHMPILVRAFFQTMQMFHKALYMTLEPRSRSGSAAQVSADQLSLLCTAQEDQFTVFTIEGNDITNIQGKLSRYDRSRIPSMTYGDAKRSTLLNVGDLTQGEAEVIDLNHQMNAVREELRALEAKRARINEKVASLTAKTQQLRQQRGMCQNELKLGGQYSRELESARRRLSDIERQLSKSAENEKQALKQTLIREVGGYQDCIRNINTCISNGLQAAVSHSVYSEALKECRVEITEIARQLRMNRQALEELQRRKRATEDERDHFVSKMNEFEEDLVQLQERLGGEAAFDRLYARCTKECPESSSAEIAARIMELNLLIGRSVDNPELLQRYDATVKEHEREKIQLGVLEAQLEHKTEEIAERLLQWEHNVETLVHKLDVLFKRFMLQLQYQGEIKLRKCGSLDTYEIIMTVSFRDQSNLSVLSAQRHSGGEKAVATIMYLMSLQGVTSSPFRVVDEINQGMDERNERLVFDRIVKECCTLSDEIGRPAVRPPQYFLVSPKLLQGLRAMDNPDVTVLMIWNGPGVRYWQLDEVIRNLKRKALNAPLEDDDLNRHERSGHSEEADSAMKMQRR